MGKVFTHILVFLVCLTVAFSCKPTSTVRKNEQLYKQNNIDIEVNYVICHENDSVSRLYYSINNSELTYKKAQEDSLFTAELHLFYKISADANAKQFLDTATVVIKDRQKAVAKGRITGSRLFKATEGSKLFMELELKDINRKALNNSQLYCNKLSKLGSQNYLLKLTDSSVVYTSYIKQGSTIAFKNKRVNNQKAYVQYAALEQKLPPPPFSVKEIPASVVKFDSAFSLNRSSNDWFSLNIEKQGCYFMSVDSMSKQGCALYSFDESFPRVTSHTQMIESIRYITTKDEYDELMEAQDKQQAIEKFWIGIGGNMDRARGLIKKYYGRVQDANTQFSSDKEGWRTDRGMIYVIFGSPAYVYQTEAVETWVYGEIGTPNALRFEFKHVNSQFSDNAFELERNVFFKDPWYLAVDAWREGRVYLDN
ncbi:MAG: GWxTD domain-containing protein [Bacteroidota bacterium]|nr:GWxTD domain-containing protein [Bacteroidota bacterium]